MTGPDVYVDWMFYDTEGLDAFLTDICDHVTENWHLNKIATKTGYIDPLTNTELSSYRVSGYILDAEVAVAHLKLMGRLPKTVMWGDYRDWSKHVKKDT